ncbi:hypothetical protein ONZ45_g7141 [Pleurotus djamor]|nr:hypothetical protein ONZ45_g7141 [Pleurotus djamor]
MAYRHALLSSHPDKNVKIPNDKRPVDMNLIKEAYEVLSTDARRKEYDAVLSERKLRDQGRAGPRPAQVVSLEEFDEIAALEGEASSWRYGCRCGGEYTITVQTMEEGEHLVGCSSCSEVVWVGYELVEED